MPLFRGDDHWLAVMGYPVCWAVNAAPGCLFSGVTPDPQGDFPRCFGLRPKWLSAANIARLPPLPSQKTIRIQGFAGTDIHPSIGDGGYGIHIFLCANDFIADAITSLSLIAVEQDLPQIAGVESQQPIAAAVQHPHNAIAGAIGGNFRG